MIVRAIGPELAPPFVPNALANPTLELHDGTGALIASNDNWLQHDIGGVITGDQIASIQTAATLPVTEGNPRSSQSCHRVTTPRSCAVRTTLPELDWSKCTVWTSNLNKAG